MQVAMNGLVDGLTIAALAVAFSVVYLPTRVFHMAMGGVYTVAPFVAWASLRRHWPWPAAALLAILAGVLLSVLCEALNHSRLERRGSASGGHLVSSLGIYIVLVEVVVLVWGNEPKSLAQDLDPVYRVGGVVLTRTQLVAAATSAALLAAFYLWLRFSRLGLQFRGLADNPAEMALRGYNVRGLRLVAFGISGLLASATGLAVAFEIGFDPYGGLSVLLLAVVAVIIGGQQSFVGPALGGVILGVLRSEVIWFLSARWQEAVTFLLLGVFLLVRPGGLFAHQRRPEAE